MTGHGSTKLGTQSALISQPIKRCVTQPYRLLYLCFIRELYRTIHCTAPTPALCSTCVRGCCTHCTCAVLRRHCYLLCFIRARTTPHPVALRLARCCTYDSPFWGQKPVIVLYRRFIKRGYFWPKKDMRHYEKLPWKCVPPPPPRQSKNGNHMF